MKKYCPVTGDYEAGVPEFGFIFPAFCDRTEDPDYIDIYEKYSERPHGISSCSYNSRRQRVTEINFLQLL